MYILAELQGQNRTTHQFMTGVRAAGRPLNGN